VLLGRFVIAVVHRHAEQRQLPAKRILYLLDHFALQCGDVLAGETRQQHLQILAVGRQGNRLLRQLLAFGLFDVAADAIHTRQRSHQIHILRVLSSRPDSRRIASSRLPRYCAIWTFSATFLPRRFRKLLEKLSTFVLFLFTIGRENLHADDDRRIRHHFVEAHSRARARP